MILFRMTCTKIFDGLVQDDVIDPQPIIDCPEISLKRFARVRVPSSRYLPDVCVLLLFT